MIHSRAPDDVVMEALKSSPGYDGISCYYEFKGYTLATNSMLHLREFLKRYESDF